MGKCCAVYGCSVSSRKKDKGISLHTFPKESTLRQKWAFATTQIPRKGFKPTNNSAVCSEHFKPEDFDVDDKNKSQNDRKRVHLKKNAIPTIFTPGLPSHLQAGEKKQCVLQRLNPISNLKPKFPPVCLADEKPCCEREAWENMPIVSSMCRKCAVFCGTNERKKAHESSVAIGKYSGMNSLARSEGLKAVKCNECGVMLDDKYTLPTHIKRVHMKMSQLHDVILGRKRLLVSRLPW